MMRPTKDQLRQAKHEIIFGINKIREMSKIEILNELSKKFPGLETDLGILECRFILIKDLVDEKIKDEWTW